MYAEFNKMDNVVSVGWLSRWTDGFVFAACFRDHYNSIRWIERLINDIKQPALNKCIEHQVLDRQIIDTDVLSLYLSSNRCDSVGLHMPTCRFIVCELRSYPYCESYPMSIADELEIQTLQRWRLTYYTYVVAHCFWLRIIKRLSYFLNTKYNRIYILTV